MHDLSAAESAGGARLEGTAFATDARSVAAWSSHGGLPCALVADRREGLRIYDLSFPEAIRQLALLPVAGALDVAVATPPAGASVALVGSPDGLTVVELAADGGAAIRGRLTGLGVRRVAVLDSERLLFAAVTGKGVVTVDCSRASEPRVLSTYQTSFGEDLFVPTDGSTKRLYVAEGYRGVSVLEASSKGELRQVSSCPDVYAAAIAGWSKDEGSGYAYVLDTTRLWQIEVLVPRWLERGKAAAP